uniref:BTB domain-containing protein n=1 Tax=Romanomermis culicivorax TaxID=13658 RepID=A0A915HWQ1_ROMCU
MRLGESSNIEEVLYKVLRKRFFRCILKFLRCALKFMRFILKKCCASEMHGPFIEGLNLARSPKASATSTSSSSKFLTPSDERSFCLLLDDDNRQGNKNHGQKSKTKIYVSKELLAVASPVFKKIFYGGHFHQTRIEPSTEYYLAGKKIDDVLEFLACLFPYRDRKKIDQSNARIVLPLAVEFEAEILTKKCLKSMRNWKLNYSI